MILNINVFFLKIGTPQCQSEKHVPHEVPISRHTPNFRDIQIP